MIPFKYYFSVLLKKRFVSSGLAVLDWQIRATLVYEKITLFIQNIHDSKFSLN